MPNKMTHTMYRSVISPMPQGQEWEFSIKAGGQRPVGSAPPKDGVQPQVCDDCPSSPEELYSTGQPAFPRRLYLYLFVEPTRWPDFNKIICSISAISTSICARWANISGSSVGE